MTRVSHNTIHQATSLFAVRGDLATLSAAQRARLFDRGRAADPGVEQAVSTIINDVRTRDDAALRELALRYDGAQLEALEVPRVECERALHGLQPAVRAALEEAARNIASFHRAQLPAPLEIEAAPGVVLGRRTEPLQRVGVYAPGGRAAYPSSVLMGVVPARVAGVGEVVVASPPGPDGLPPAAVLAACALARADRLFALGGAGAIAAFAFGTRTVPRVDKIVGPGNVYVNEAKRQLTGVVAIDTPAGPSEILVLADDSADPALIAAELLAQAEHDPDAAAVLVCIDAATADAVATAVTHALANQLRVGIIRTALAAHGALLVASDMADAIAFAANYAPEHLLVMTRDARALLPRLRHAGTIFLGASSSVAFGDYITGANHVLPTSGLARAYSGLSTLDFLRQVSYQEISPAAAARLAEPTVALANAEGLPAHAMAAALRREPARVDIAYVRALENGIPLRSAYRDITPYDPGRLPCETDLSDNTNLFGPAPSVRRAVQQASDSTITRYPSVYAPELKLALAQFLNVAPENIATGCGSDDVIDSAIRAFCEPGARVAFPDPTFGMVPVFARMNATSPQAVRVHSDFSLDVDALVSVRAPVTYLCRPNNPTGTSFERGATLRVCHEASGVVLIDEAYADFADDDLVQEAVNSSRAVVLRTMSKAFGMAGLRVGFAIGPSALIAEIEKSRGPYKVNALAEAAALAVLTHDLEWVRERVAETRRNRERLQQQLQIRGITTWPSAANFVLVGVTGLASAWNRELRARGVAVRPFAQLPHAGECLRVSIGPWPMIERLLAAFDEVADTPDLVNT